MVLFNAFASVLVVLCLTRGVACANLTYFGRENSPIEIEVNESCTLVSVPHHGKLYSSLLHVFISDNQALERGDKLVYSPARDYFNYWVRERGDAENATRLFVNLAGVPLNECLGCLDGFDLYPTGSVKIFVRGEVSEIDGISADIASDDDDDDEQDEGPQIYSIRTRLYDKDQDTTLVVVYVVPLTGDIEMLTFKEPWTGIPSNIPKIRVRLNSSSGLGESKVRIFAVKFNNTGDEESSQLSISIDVLIPKLASRGRSQMQVSERDIIVTLAAFLITVATAFCAYKMYRMVRPDTRFVWERRPDDDIDDRKSSVSIHSVNSVRAPPPIPTERGLQMLVAFTTTSDEPDM